RWEISMPTPSLRPSRNCWGAGKRQASPPKRLRPNQRPKTLMAFTSYAVFCLKKKNNLADIDAHRRDSKDKRAYMVQEELYSTYHNDNRNLTLRLSWCT